MTVLVTGGAGYIGAHVVRVLRGAGRPVVVVDDLSTGYASRLEDVAVVVQDVAAPGAVDVLSALMRSREVDEVVHLAARKRVDESIEQPLHYYRQNVTGLANVLEAVQSAEVDRFVFSSSAAVYGETEQDTVDEDVPTRPVNPYGETKLAGEWLVRDVARACGLRACVLRYFNVAGSGWDDLGDPAVLNLVTMVLDRLSREQAPHVFGTDYPTSDGTCVRDFVHVLDLAEAHVAALDHLRGASPGTTETFNVGTGVGASVLEVVQHLVELSGVHVRPVVEPRRAGDPARVVASVERIADVIGWRARHDLSETLRSAASAWAYRARTS